MFVSYISTSFQIWQGRARQLYSNGYRTLEDVAKSTVGDLVEKIEHLNYRVAKQLISAAKVSSVRKDFRYFRVDLTLQRYCRASILHQK